MYVYIIHIIENILYLNVCYKIMVSSFKHKFDR